MNHRYALPVLAVIGLALAISTVIQGNQTRSLVEPAVQSAKVPFSPYVAGAGMIEASTENIAIGTPVSGIVAAIYVTWGDRVNAGEPLFKIDDRDLQGQLPVAVAKVKESEATLAKKSALLAAEVCPDAHGTPDHSESLGPILPDTESIRMVIG